jgi:hypothetical protein
MQPARGAAGRKNADGVLAIANFCIFPIQRFNFSTNPWQAKALATAARGDSPRLAPRHQQNPVP